MLPASPLIKTEFFMLLVALVPSAFIRPKQEPGSRKSPQMAHNTHFAP
jgi:hypothetical protein